jgi:DNA-binding NtrC family response regulator
MSAAQSWGMDRVQESGIVALGARRCGVTARVVVVVSADVALRQRLKDGLTALRWNVREAGGGAQAMAMVEEEQPEAVVVDGWLPDLEAGEFQAQLEQMCQGTDIVTVDGTVSASGARSPRRNELLHVLRMAQEDGACPQLAVVRKNVPAPPADGLRPVTLPLRSGLALPEMVGESAAILELARLIRLVAPKSATVLIEGETGTGKEVVAKAIHRLSARAGKPFVVLNCAAIPEALLEAELFGHTRGAFTGAVQSRTGRIEAAHGGTLFLDEIGEMPLALQAKMLRFLECGELQKVGENESVRVDVRVIAATHQELERRAEEKTFRLDLYHRLAVFPLDVPALRERMEDLPLLVEFFLEQMGKDAPRKRITPAAMAKLREYAWAGNVRELMHVLERGAILAEDRAEIGADEVRLTSRR